MIDSVPPWARDPQQTNRVYFATRSSSDDPFLQGAHWALAAVLGDFAGPLLGGSLFTDLVDREELQGGTWVPVA